MKRMKYVAMLLFAALSFSAAMADAAHAQRRGGPVGPGAGVRAQQNVDYLVEKLALNEAQVEPVRTLLAEHRAATLAWFRENPGATRAERAAFHQEHRAGLESALGEVLTEEQMATFRTTLPAWGTMRQAFARSMDRPGRAARMASGAGLAQRLDLTDEQAAQLDAFRTGHRAALQEWLKANPDATRAERRVFMEEHWASRNAALESILTEKQLEELNSLRPARRDRPMRGAERRPGRGAFRG